jgi:hypothetical protein
VREANCWIILAHVGRAGSKRVPRGSRAYFEGSGGFADVESSCVGKGAMVKLTDIIEYMTSDLASASLPLPETVLPLSISANVSYLVLVDLLKLSAITVRKYLQFVMKDVKRRKVWQKTDVAEALLHFLSVARLSKENDMDRIFQL